MTGVWQTRRVGRRFSVIAWEWWMGGTLSDFTTGNPQGWFRHGYARTRWSAERAARKALAP